jgi:hypothetical protein
MNNLSKEKHPNYKKAKFKHLAIPILTKTKYKTIINHKISRAIL